MVLRCLSLEQPSTSFLPRPMPHTVVFVGKSERWFCLLVWMQACILPHGVMKHLSSSNFAAVWDTFCLPPPQSCSHLLQLFNTGCATVCHTHLPFCSPFTEISFFWWGVGRQSTCGCQITILLPAILGMPLKILLLAFSLNSTAASTCKPAGIIATSLQQRLLP